MTHRPLETSGARGMSSQVLPSRLEENCRRPFVAAAGQDNDRAELDDMAETTVKSAPSADRGIRTVCCWESLLAMEIVPVWANVLAT